MSGQKGRVKFFNLKEIQCGETTSMDEGAKGGGGMIEGRNDLKLEKSSFIALGCKLLKQNIPPIYVRPHSGNRGP